MNRYYLGSWIFLLWTLIAVSEVGAETLAPASKRTGWVISELMYHPADRADGKNLEYIEIYNSEPWAEDLSGYQLKGEVRYLFPTNTIVPALGFLVVAGVPLDVSSVYGLPTVLGPFSEGGKLSNDSGRVELWSRSGALLLEVDYEDSEPWPVSPDGSGHSLILLRPSYGQGEVKAWSASSKIGGSPGKIEPVSVDPMGALVINEVLPHPNLGEVGFIEIYNHSTVALSLAGCVLTDNATTNRFVIGNVSIPANGFVAFDLIQLGFALRVSGDSIYLKNASGDKVLNAVRFGAQEKNVAWGRFPNGVGEFYRLKSHTPRLPNASILLSTIAINELMYHPLSGDDNDQYIELLNSGSIAVDVSGWQLEGGVKFTMPTNSIMRAGEFLVVAKDRGHLMSLHTNLTAKSVVGNFNGRLAHGGERVTLSVPEINTATNAAGLLETNKVYIVVDEVTYKTGGRWGQWADGGGSSLELVDARGNHRLAGNWADSDESFKAGWTRIETTGMLDNGSGATPPDQLQMILQDAGECLVDNVEVVGPSGINSISNATLEVDSAGWSAIGTMEGSALEIGAGFESANSYHVRAGAQDKILQIRRRGLGCR